jgi:hypothetical protein
MCGRELVLRFGGRPVDLFGDHPTIVTKREIERFDDHRLYYTDYVYCDEACLAAFDSWNT